MRSDAKAKIAHLDSALFTMFFLIIYWFFCLDTANPTIKTGILHFGWLGKILSFIIIFHITMTTNSIYLHRSQTHRAVEYIPFLNHCFRFWMWLTTGFDRAEWVAIHRLHHQKPDQPEDPHSPLYKGTLNLFLKGIEIYQEARNPEIIRKYGYIKDNDYLEKRFYSII